jgi:hypothetical protein
MEAEDFIKSENVSYTYYDKNGNALNDVSSSCAYIERKGTGDSYREKYYLKTLRGSLYDPQGIDGAKANSLNTKFSKVSSKTFDHYIKYLITKQRNHLTWADRSNIDV